MAWLEATGEATPIVIWTGDNGHEQTGLRFVLHLLKDREARGRVRGDGPVFIGGCILIGIGLGMLFDHTAAGAIIGVGAGLILEALWRQRKSGA